MTQNTNPPAATAAKKPSRIDNIEDVMNQILDVVEKLVKRVDELEKSAPNAKRQLFGGKGQKGRTAMVDTKTGKTYVSKAAIGKALAVELGLDPLDHFVYYKIQTQFPDRMKEATEAESQAAWDKEAADKQKEIEDTNKRLAAEEEKAKNPPKTA
ncbi:MAG: hypothetical protein PHI12_14205 [Dehalococcoidales bacterium]|jgi:small-conductance mechanosensitive channel|nr:hypothetical protein [Dehalococcoidales bacterium]